VEFVYFAVYHSDNDSDWTVCESREEAERVANEWVGEDWAQDLFRNSDFLEIYVCQVPAHLIPSDEEREALDARYEDWSLWNYTEKDLQDFGGVTVHADWVNAGNQGKMFTITER